MNSRRYVSSHASFGILAVLISHSHAQVIFRCACRVVFFNDYAAITLTIQADATGLPTELEEEYQGRFFDNTPDGGYVRRHLHSLFLLRSDLYALSLPRQVITIPLHATAAVLSNHLVHVHVCSSLAFPCSSAALKSMLIKQWNPNNLQGEVSFLVAIFMLSTLLQYATNKYVFL